MRVLSSIDCLEIWERGERFHPLDRSLLALRAALPETSRDDLADWPLGRRNRALAELRCASFGFELAGWVACPSCGEKMEFKMDARTLGAGSPPAADGGAPAADRCAPAADGCAPAADGCAPAADRCAPAADGWTSAADRCASAADGWTSATDECAPVIFKGESFRLPTSRDLAAAAREADPRQAAVRLLDACRLTPSVSRQPWSDQELDEAGECLAMADPLAENRLTLDCAVCGNQWEETLDIGDFLWTEVDARARRLLMEVHALASAYGWSEGEILSLSETRRRFYLEMVRE